MLAVAAGLGLGGWAATATSYDGRTACAQSRREMIDWLARVHKERVVELGLDHNGALVERLQSLRGATWSIIRSVPGGASCFVAGGTSWQVVLTPNKLRAQARPPRVNLAANPG